MAKALTTEEFVEKAIAVHGKRFDYSKVIYRGYLKTVTIICPDHGAFEQKPNNHLAGANCPSCGNHNRGASTRSDVDEFMTKAASVHGEAYDYSLVDYKNSRTPVKVVCKKHQYTFTVVPNTHLQGRRPACCSRNGFIGRDGFIRRAREVHGDRYEYGEEYHGTKKNVTIICSEHGPFEQLPENHLVGKGCPRCIGRMMWSLQDFVRIAKAEHGELYDYGRVDYAGATNKVEIVCRKHGPFWQMPYNHVGGNGCPACVSRVSAAEQGLYEWVRELCPDAEQGNRSLIAPKELDIYVPSRKLAIEFNGLRYHSDALGVKKDTYHYDKHKACLDRGVRLIHVWEDDIELREQAMRHIIARALGVTGRRLFARRLTVAVVQNAAASAFCDRWHIQGGTRAASSYGLFEGDDMVAAMMFSSVVSERGKAADGRRFELVRYATSQTVVGGASRLLSAFLKDTPDAREIVSYSSNDHFSGGMYAALGFKRVGELAPDYKVVESGIRRHKANYKLSTLARRFPETFDPALTERENCRRHGLYRIYNSGGIKWSLAI